LSAQQFQQVLITFIVIWQPKAGLKQSHKRRHKQLPINNTHGAAIGSAHNIRLNHSIFSEFYQLYDIKVSFFTRGIVSSQKAFGRGSQTLPSHPLLDVKHTRLLGSGVPFGIFNFVKMFDADKIRMIGQPHG